MLVIYKYCFIEFIQQDTMTHWILKAGRRPDSNGAAILAPLQNLSKSRSIVRTRKKAIEAVGNSYDWQSIGIRKSIHISVLKNGLLILIPPTPTKILAVSSIVDEDMAIVDLIHNIRGRIARWIAIYIHSVNSVIVRQTISQLFRNAVKFRLIIIGHQQHTFVPTLIRCIMIIADDLFHDIMRFLWALRYQTTNQQVRQYIISTYRSEPVV